ncbi:polyadenylation and cleavage factor homolog 4-like [Tasmannia lanceolata]|uniref:polyadenylation and cleavage factor homolog 4-like n=1 Tax=Tasmannia lanceolata TaxID=3420 RepID=UPI004063839B
MTFFFPFSDAVVIIDKIRVRVFLCVCVCLYTAMESSGRSMARAREPGTKKPRLAEEAEPNLSSSNGRSIIDRDRPFPQRVPGPLIPRIRANEKEREDPARGAFQEIVEQYKTALAELTFNSKPIITNLTIIAGENLHAAKWIAATVCANIIEVPSEQKLPSLYLLDSIVKNIGRDYIRYFAAKLPEVFCKAYGQVDSSIHSSMRHLFGTWKGVFPPASLQIIEKELGFPPAINGSSSGATTSRSDSQSQNPPHSIHVNPKYLEARQRLQQSSRSKGISSDNSGSTGSGSAEDVEKPDRTAITKSARPWPDLPVKIHNVQRPQREQLNEATLEKNPSAGYRDYEFVSDPPLQSDIESGKSREKIAERGLDKPWYGAGNNVADAPTGRRNSFDIPTAFENHRAQRSTRAISRLHPTQAIANRSGRGTSGNWKNSEEEEYMWEDMNSRLTDHGVTHSSRKDGWNPDDAEKLISSQRGKWMPLETEHLDTRRNTLSTSSRLEKPSGGEDTVPLRREREVEDYLPSPRGRQDIGSKEKREAFTDSLSGGGQAAFGHRVPSVWPPPEPHPVDVFKASILSGQSEGHPTAFTGNIQTSSSLSLNRTGPRVHMGPSVGFVSSSFESEANSISRSSGMFGHQRNQPPRPASPSESASTHQRLHSPSLSSTHQHHQPPSLTDLDLPQVPAFPQLVQKSSHNSFAIAPQNHIPSSSLQSLQLPLSQPLPHLQSSTPPLMSLSQLRHHLPFSQQPESEASLQQTQSQLSGQMQKPPSQPSNIGVPQTLGYPRSGNSNDAVAEVLGQSSSSSLLASIMKNGLVTNTSAASSFPSTSYPSSSMPLNLNIQPPLPVGPPPVQLKASSSNLSAIATQPLRAIPPPLPPGPPPPSSLVGTSAQMSSTASAVPNPLSNLLSSLVAKGLISASATELPVLSPPQVPTKLHSQSADIAISSSMLVSSSSAASTIPPSSSVKEHPFVESSAKGNSLSQATTGEITDLIGTEFKPEIIRELHPSAISALYDDLSYQCSICGFRLKLQEQLDRHMDCHASEKHGISRKWYASFSNWVAGNVGPNSEPISTSVEGTIPTAERCEPMVPADDSQCVCVLCGETFEDFYSLERNEWMYKGAVYMTIQAGKGDQGGAGERNAQGPIVHAHCISKNNDFEVAEHDKVDQTDG